MARILRYTDLNKKESPSHRNLLYSFTLFYQSSHSLLTGGDYYRIESYESMMSSLCSAITQVIISETAKPHTTFAISFRRGSSLNSFLYMPY